MKTAPDLYSPFVPADVGQTIVWPEGTQFLPSNGRSSVGHYSLDWIPAYAGMSGYKPITR